MSRARIIVDWGTTNFRAYRFGGDGALMGQHQAEAGILSVADRAFETVLDREIGHWIDATNPIYFSGMITSRNGWVETPYAELPAALPDLSAFAQNRRGAGGTILHFLPGLCARGPLPDVMRGEEIQVFGAIAPMETITLVLPGTHSKWVKVEQGRITAFRTFMTGEAFALFKAHSILGRLIPRQDEGVDEAAFQAGLLQALDGQSAGLLNDLFTARSGVLLGQAEAAGIPDRLSGLLIGHEIAGGLRLGWHEAGLRLVGEAALCARYRRAFAVGGIDVPVFGENATLVGFSRLAALGQGAPETR